MAHRRHALIRGGFLGTIVLAGALVACNQGGGEGGGGGGGEISEFAIPPAVAPLHPVRSSRRVARRVKRSAAPSAR